MQPVDILAIGVHPDDVELSCSGTLIKHIEKGYTVGLLDLTRGELGSRGTAETRDQEAADSSKILGAKFRENLRMADGFFQHNPENLKKIIRIIRAAQPKIVLTNAISDRHPDHGRAAKLTADACFLSGLLKIETVDNDGKPQKHWRPKVMYHYIQDYYQHPDFVVDITPYWDKKVEMIMAFKTQFYNPDSKEPETPISGLSFLEFIKARSRDYGRPAGYEFGEGFVKARYIGVDDLFDLD